MQQFTIGIVGGGWVNKGAEAMTYTVIRELRKRLGEDCRFLIFLKRRDGEHTIAVSNVETVDDKTGKLRFLSEMFAVLLYALTKVKRYRSGILQGLDACDAIVDIHGYYLHDRNSLKAIGFSLSRLLMTKMMRKTYYVFPQSFGPLKDKKRSFLASLILPLADKVCMRGQESRTHLAPVMKRHLKRSEIVPDIALIFDKEFATERIEELFETEGLPSEQKLCAISPNTNLLRENAGYVALMAKVVEWIVREYEYGVVLIPHELKEAGRYDDAGLCQDIRMALSPETSAEHVYIISGRNYSAKDYKAFVSRCSMMIASRYHMAIAALSLNIPTLTLGWSFKYRELMTLFEVEEFAIDGRDEKAFYSQVTQAFRVLVDQHHEVGQRLQLWNQQHQTVIENFFEDVAQHIRAKV